MNFNEKIDTEKLESIFMPFMTKEKEKLKNSNNKFVHYTSAENAMNIINSKKLWMRSPKCMNDFMEIHHGHGQLVKFFEVKDNLKKYIAALDLYKEGTGKVIINNFNEWWNEIKDYTYIASISVHNVSEDLTGRLSMWRAYGQESAKAALVINNPPHTIEGLNVILSPAAYFNYEELEQEICSMIDNIQKNIGLLKTLDEDEMIGMAMTALMILAVCLKHVGFKEEKEWRIIHLPNLSQPNRLIENKVEVIGGIPQVVYKLPFQDFPEDKVVGMSISSLIDKVIIGPTQYPSVLSDAFTIALQTAGVEDASNKIVISDIPLRT
jgi:hypothetical protein